MTQLTTLINTFITFINNVLVPLVFALALVAFLVGVFRYLIAGADNPEKRKTGGEIILYSVIGFAVMISVWGLVNLVVGTFGFSNTNRPCLPTFNATNDCSGNGGTGAAVQKDINNKNSNGDSKSAPGTTAPGDPSFGGGDTPDPATGLPPIY